MKLSYTRIFFVAVAFVAFYTSCKKSGTTPVVKTTTDYDTVSRHIALNLVQSLTGTYGGTDINEGIKSQTNVTGSHSENSPTKKILLCGFTIDTTFNSKAQIKDTAKTYIGKYKFVYTCTSVRPDGYTANDSLVTVATSSSVKNKFTFLQKFTAKALDTTYKLIETNGLIQLTADNGIYVNGFSEGYNYNVNTYKLNGLKVDFSGTTPDVISGSATFESTTSYLHPGDIDVTTVTVSGTIQFLGNHKVKLSLNKPGKSFTVDLTTGVTTAI